MATPTYRSVCTQHLNSSLSWSDDLCGSDHYPLYIDPLTLLRSFEEKNSLIWSRLVSFQNKTNFPSYDETKVAV